MAATPDNPAGNKLGPGVSEEALEGAILRSGYPLQAVVAGTINSQVFHIQQEWGYIDKDSGERRTIDILAQNPLWRRFRKQPEVRPKLALIIECKQSELPYVFFLCSNPEHTTFSLMCGLPRDSIEIATDDSSSIWNHTIQHALGLDTHPFATLGPRYCVSFARCIRQGKRIELSGEEVFNKVVLPLTKAMMYFREVESPVRTRTRVYFDLHLIIGMAVIDAPMVGVFISGQSHELAFLPWVRVVRHEGGTSLTASHLGGYYAIDIVHKDFLSDYLNKHLMPFSNDFSRLVVKHQRILASGEAFAQSFGEDWWNNIEQRLKPKRTGGVKAEAVSSEETGSQVRSSRKRRSG